MKQWIQCQTKRLFKHVTPNRIGGESSSGHASNQTVAPAHDTQPNQTKPNPNHQVGLTDPTQYEHRVGRTGRAGKTGLALLLLSDDESKMLGLLGGFPITGGVLFLLFFFGGGLSAGLLLGFGGPVNGAHNSVHPAKTPASQ